MQTLSRIELVRQAVTWSGSGVRVLELRNGWPSLLEVQTSLHSDPVPVSAFVSTVTLGGRGRDDTERRIQNPGENRPIIVPASTIPILLGVWHQDQYIAVPTPVFIAASAWKRAGRTTRHSTFVRIEGLSGALANGLAHCPNDDGEIVTCFLPHLLAHVVEQLAIEQATVITDDADSTPLAGPLAIDVVHRRRVVASRLVRTANFGAAVVAAYDGRCALCELDLELVQAAHIVPVAAPHSSDAVANGICLCANHHVAFDRHYIFIDPTTRRVQLHPWLLNKAKGDPAATSFCNSTRGILRLPSRTAARPPDEAFLQRYSYFSQSYDWNSAKVTDTDEVRPDDDSGFDE